MSWRGPSLRLRGVGPSVASEAALREAVRALLLERWGALLDPVWRRVARGWLDRGEESLVFVGSPEEPPGSGPAERLDLLLRTGAPGPWALVEHWLARALFEDGAAPLRARLAAEGYELAADARLPRVDAARFVHAAGRLGLVTEDGVEWQGPLPVRAPDAALPAAERAGAAWVRAGGPCGCGPCVAADRAAPWRAGLGGLVLAGEEALVPEPGAAGGRPARLLGAVPGLGVALLASPRGPIVHDLRARRPLLEPTTTVERLPAAPPGADVDGWLARALGARAALGVEPAPGPLAWSAPQPWPATGPGHERRAGRAPGVDVVLVRDGAGTPVALRARCPGPPTFELAWKAEAAGEVALTAAVTPRQLGRLRAALREALAPPGPEGRAEREAEARQLAALEALADATPWVAPASEPRPEPRPRAELLRVVAAAAADAGAALDALDRGGGGAPALAALDADARAAIAALPAPDRAALEPVAARGLAGAWSELEALARALLTREPPAPPPTPSPPEEAAARGARLRARAEARWAEAGRGALGAWGEAAALLREALEVAPPRKPPDLAAQWLRVVHFAAAAGDLAAARGALDAALAAHGNSARFALHQEPLSAWRAELAPAALRSKLPKALAPHADALAATLRPVTRLSAVPGDPGVGPTSRLGGRPSLPPGEAWPAGPDGAPMRFLLQVDLAATPPQPPLPRRGLLLVFLVDGPGLGHGLRERAVRALHVASPPAVAVEGPPPAVPLVPTPCGLTGFADVEPAAPPDVAFARRCPTVASDRAAVRALRKAHPLTGSKLCGHAYFAQEDPRAGDAARADHVQLLQLDEVPAAGLTLGDGGVGHVFLPAGDLERLDLSRAWWHWDCR